MHICLVSAAFRPYLSGVSEHVHNLGIQLQSRGHHVHILTARYPGLEATTPEPDSIPVTRIGRGLILPANRGRFTLPVGLNLSGQVKKFFRTHQFDVVHCHGIFPPEIAYWAARSARVPIVVTFHTLVVRTPGFVRSGFRFLFPGLQRNINARIAVSEACKEWAESWFPGRYHIIPNGVDTDMFSPEAMPAELLCGSGPSILYVGRLDKRKGLPVLLRALPHVLNQVPETRLVAVGSGPLEKHCRRLCRKLGIEQSVVFAGPVQPENLAGFYAGATVFASPALGPESMGIVLIEAMACARPVVASAIPGYNEVISHNKDGILVPAGDTIAWAGALVSLLKSEESRHRLGQNGLIRARTFAWPGVTDQVETVYHEVME